MSGDDGDPARWARDGDRDAFSVFHHRHAEAVWGHGDRVTASGAAAEDVPSATCLTAWRRRADVRLDAVSARPAAQREAVALCLVAGVSASPSAPWRPRGGEVRAHPGSTTMG